MTNFNLYKIFMVVAEQKNITKASEMLHISQPALSFNIKQLEEDLNCELFIRKNKGVELSTLGKLLYEKVSPIINKLEELENFSLDQKLLKEGLIKIGVNSANSNQIIGTSINAFARKFPNVYIKIVRLSQKELLEKLTNNELDLIFIDYCNLENNLEIIKEYFANYQLLGNKSYYDKYKNLNILSKDFPINDIILPTPNNKSREYIDKFLNDNNILVNVKYELDNYSLLYDFVKDGLGIAFFNSDYYKEELKNGKVFILSKNLKIDARRFICVHNKNFYNPSKTELIKIIKNN